MTVAFGAPERGLPAMIEDVTAEAVRSSRTPDEGAVETEPADEADSSAVEPGVPGRFDLWLNAIPNQGSEVVRTEEAMFAALGCLTLTE